MPFGLIGAVIGAGASLIGANKQKKANQQAQAAQNAYNEEQTDPAEIRRKFEAAGYNPLLGVQGWQPAQQTGYVPSNIGSAISEAGAIFGNYFDAKAKEKSALTAAHQENAKLKERLRDQMLRPAVGGIFGGGDKPLRTLTSVLTPAGDPRTQPVGPGTPWDADPKGKAASDEAYRPGVTPGMAWGLPWRRSGLFSDGEWWEAAYGDNPFVTWPIGVASSAADLGYNVKGWQNEALSRGRGVGPTMRIGGQDYKLHDSKAMRSTAKNPLRDPAAMSSAITRSYRGNAN